jgi:hypothetical protein
VPVSFVILFVQVFTTTWVVLAVRGTPRAVTEAIGLGGWGYLALLIPLVVYWWALKAADGLRYVLRGLYRWGEKRFRPVGA